MSTLSEKLPSDYKFTEQDMETAWPLWFRDFDGETLTEEQDEFVFLAFEAERHFHRKKFWPTLAQLLAMEDCKKEWEASENT